MKHFYAFIVLLLTFVGSANAQNSFQWGTATWNIQDNWTFESIEDFNASGLVLTFPNPTNYNLTMLNIVAVNFNLFVDDATEPIEATTSAQKSTAVQFGYPFVEGHKYHVVTTLSFLAQANLATYTTDTLSVDNTSYEITFTIKGPELVKTIDVEESMSLTITSQDYDLTYSLIDTKSILDALGINNISEGTVYALQSDDSYVSYEWYGPDYFDGWRDADGDYTSWYGGWNAFAGHNSYPAVYCIKINQDCDTISYFFYDYWKEYDPDDSGETGGGTIGTTKKRAPETSYNSMIWTWDNGDGTTTDYNRMWRCDEGKDYKAAFVVKANNKYVRINATLHFISQEDYAIYMAVHHPKVDEPTNNSAIYNLSGVRLNSLQKGINIVGGKKIFVK